MMKKLIFPIFTMIVAITSSCVLFSDSQETENFSKDKFNNIINKADSLNWSQKPLNLIISKVGLEFINTPYLAWSLEKSPERCIINLEGLDCVTFFENALNIARIIKDKKNSIDDLFDYVTYTRYRDGKLDGYISRLHYTSEWILNNQKKDIVKDITKELGGIIFPVNVFYMSKYYQKYDALKHNPELVPSIKKIEDNINNNKFYYIPKDKIKQIECKLKTGDIIAIATNIKGLDYSHTGLIYEDENGRKRLLHASSKKKKVYLDTSISEYIKNKKKDIGITVLRVVD